MRVFFMTEKSKLRNPGPTAMLRPALPKVSVALGVNAAVLNHCDRRRFKTCGRMLRPYFDHCPSKNKLIEVIEI